MALIVEDGTGLANADALVSSAFCDAYHLARGNTAWTGSADVKEPAIRRATAYLSNSFAWRGQKRLRRAQALAWPRTDVTDEAGEAVAYNAVPVEVQQACAEIALAELIIPGCMTPAVVMADRISREEIGQIKVEYALGGSVDAYRPNMTIVSDLLSGLLCGSTNPLVGSAVRA